MAVSPGNSTETQTETSSLCLKEAYFLTLKTKTSKTYLGANCNSHKTPEKPTGAIIVLSLCPTSGHPCLVKGACAPVRPPRFCGCCQRTHSLSCSPGLAFLGPTGQKQTKEQLLTGCLCPAPPPLLPLRAKYGRNRQKLASPSLLLKQVRGNKQEGQGSPNGGNRLQVSDSFSLSLKRQEETNYKCQTFFS